MVEIVARLTASDLNREEGMILFLLNETDSLSESDINEGLVSTPPSSLRQQRIALLSLQHKGLIVAPRGDNRGGGVDRWETTRTGHRLVEADFAQASLLFPKDDRS